VTPPATRDQADAHRYRLRRLEAALVRGDAIPLHEHLRSQRRATLVGAFLAVLTLVVAAVLAALAPTPEWREQAVVIGSPSGAVYAVGRERLVPVVDAVAGRLVRAALDLPAGEPRLVPDAALATAPRTAPAAATGAPGVRLDGAVPERWGVCDGPSVLVGTAAPGPPVPALWARTPGGDIFAVLDGVRHTVGDTTVRAGLGLGGREPQTVSAAVLSALPEGPPLTLPELPDGPGPVGVPGRPGDVLATTSVDGVRRLVAVLPGGVQEVPATVAEVLRARGGAGPREVAPAVVAEAPIRVLLPVAGWPAATPEWAAGPVCSTWSEGRWGLVRASPMPVLSNTVTVGLAAGGTAVLAGGGPVRAVSPTGGGAVWLVSGSGVAYGIADQETADALTLGPIPTAPESLLRLLPRGATLSVTETRSTLSP
jgi:type VII secretion protein EccB